MVFASIFAILVGLAMIAQWTMSYLTRQIPELATEPIRIGFHIAAELVTALVLIASGVGLLANGPWGRILFPVAIGMLLYTSIVSPGYFAQKGQRAWLVVFGLLIALAIISLILVSGNLLA
jgi:hypothetical protein